MSKKYKKILMEALRYSLVINIFYLVIYLVSLDRFNILEIILTVLVLTSITIFSKSFLWFILKIKK